MGSIPRTLLRIDRVLEPNNASPLNPDAANLWNNPDGGFCPCENCDPAYGVCRFQNPVDEALSPAGEFGMRRTFITLLSYLVVWLCRQVSADDLPVDLVPAFYNRCTVTARRIFFHCSKLGDVTVEISSSLPSNLFHNHHDCVSWRNSSIRIDCIYRRKF